MEEKLLLSYEETVENTTVDELKSLYEDALQRCNFRHFEFQKEEGIIHHKAIWGRKQDSEGKSFFTKDAIREEMQRFCAQASFEQIEKDVRFTLEIIPWMESEDEPEEFRKSQGRREKTFDEIYARLRLEELLSAMPGVGDEPDDILYAPHYENLPREEKLKRLNQRFQDKKMSSEMYEKIKKWIEAGN
jgi:hypothetical protein